VSPIIVLHDYLVVGAILFTLGLIGFLTRRNFIILFLCAEMMLQGVAINLVAFARVRGNLHGQVFVLFMLTVAACEAAIALVLVLMLYRARHTLDVSVWQELREPDQPSTADRDPGVSAPPETPLPHLPPAGVEPQHPEDLSRV
jgi:NADH-quinone oxidoreductase subunit K